MDVLQQRDAGDRDASVGDRDHAAPLAEAVRDLLDADRAGQRCAARAAERERDAGADEAHVGAGRHVRGAVGQHDRRRRCVQLEAERPRDRDVAAEVESGFERQPACQPRRRDDQAAVQVDRAEAVAEGETGVGDRDGHCSGAVGVRLLVEGEAAGERDAADGERNVRSRHPQELPGRKVKRESAHEGGGVGRECAAAVAGLP